MVSRRIRLTSFVLQQCVPIPGLVRSRSFRDRRCMVLFCFPTLFQLSKLIFMSLMSGPGSGEHKNRHPRVVSFAFAVLHQREDCISRGFCCFFIVVFIKQRISLLLHESVLFAKPNLPLPLGGGFSRMPRCSPCVAVNFL